MKKNKKQKKFLIICAIVIFIVVLCITLVVFISIDNTKGVIELRSKADDIYEWQYEIKDKKIVKYVEKKKYGDFEDKHGGNITEKYIFKSLKPGKTTIKFTSVNKNNKSYLDIKTYEAKVDKKLHLTITETKNE